MIPRRVSATKRPPTLADVRKLFANGERGGYWRAEAADLFEDSAGTTAASLNGVVGLWANAISGGPSAIQATTANKPYLRETPTTRRRWLDGNTATANLTATWGSSLGASCTIATIDPELGVVWQENQTIATTRNLITPYSYHGPQFIINRALTAAEKAVVARVMTRAMPQLGPNLFNDPGFDNPSAWLVNNGWSVENGVARKVATASTMSLQQNLPLLITSYYHYGFTVIETNGVTLLFQGFYGNLTISAQAVGRYRATAGNKLGNFVGPRGYAATQVVVDDATIREVL